MSTLSQTLGEIQQCLRESLNSLRKPKAKSVADIYMNNLRVRAKLGQGILGSCVTVLC